MLFVGLIPYGPACASSGEPAVWDCITDGLPPGPEKGIITSKFTPLSSHTGYVGLKRHGMRSRLGSRTRAILARGAPRSRGPRSDRPRPFGVGHAYLAPSGLGRWALHMRQALGVSQPLSTIWGNPAERAF